MLRKFHNNRTYKDTILCFICGQVGRIATHCPRKHNSYNRETDTETVYSMVSEIDYEALDLEELEEQEEDKNMNNFIDMIQNFQGFEIEHMMKDIPNDNCDHDWEHDTGSDDRQCFVCRWFPSIHRRQNVRNVV